MTQELIEDHESLYRRVPNSENPHFGLKDGRFRFFSSAFNDSPGYKPSVDRAKLKNSPHESKKKPDDGIVSLAANNIRAISSVENNEIKHLIDIYYRPIHEEPKNLAHSQVEPAPAISEKKVFKKLQDALARLATEAGWLIEPNKNSPDTKG